MNAFYFNNAFSRRLLPEVSEALQTCMSQSYENPLTESEDAETARSILHQAREASAELLNVKAGEVYFVSSGTEANNWALKGLSHAWQWKKNHLVISAIEHFSVYQTAQFLKRGGVEVTEVPVDSSGRIDPADVASAIRPSTFAVSIQAASDEIGVVQDLNGIASLKNRFPDVIFHTDAIQYLCYEDLDAAELPFDLISFSSNALYGPPGIAALFIREGTRIVPLIHGGMQEDGMRAGLQAIPLVAGFCKAVEINKKRKLEWKKEIRGIQSSFFSLMNGLNVPITGSVNSRLVDNVHAIADVDGEALLSLLLADRIRASTGSTCYQYAQKESHVLKALGIDAQKARGSVLFTIGIDSINSDLDPVFDSFRNNLTHLRSLLP